jgi:uncharacterized damage-inducible protein DinB
MASPTSEQASFLLQMMLGSLKSEFPATRRVIQAIPADKGDYRPDEVSKTALELAWHIVNTERMFLDAVASGGFDLSPYPKPPGIRNSSDLDAWYAKMFEKQTALVAQLPPEDATRILDFRGMFQMPALNFLQFATVHTIHHRGQLSMYLRPMGAKVPSIYGDSYDSALAKKAQP